MTGVARCRSWNPESALPASLAWTQTSCHDPRSGQQGLPWPRRPPSSLHCATPFQMLSLPGLLHCLTQGSVPGLPNSAPGAERSAAGSSAQRLRSASAQAPQGPLGWAQPAPAAWALPCSLSAPPPGQAQGRLRGARGCQGPLHTGTPASCARLTSSLSHGWPGAVAVGAGDSRVPPKPGAGHWDNVASCQPCWAASPHWRSRCLGLLGMVTIAALGEEQGSPETSGCQEAAGPLG